MMMRERSIGAGRARLSRRKGVLWQPGYTAEEKGPMSTRRSFVESRGCDAHRAAVAGSGA
jgi:hypothetical protein